MRGVTAALAIAAVGCVVVGGIWWARHRHTATTAGQPGAAPSREGSSDPTDIGGLFKRRGVVGTLVISSFDGEVEHVWNPDRADQRFSPASTFKIPHALIALEERAVQDERERLTWDGVDRGWAEWNRDHDLASAFQRSCVWFFQHVARRLDAAIYERHLERLPYGNGVVGDDVEAFWLDGSLSISAREQIRFLKRLHAEELELDARTIAIVKRIMVVERTADHVLRAKTGWGRREGVPDVGWWVGYVEKSDDAWFFAINLQIARRGDSKYREEIVRAALRSRGILGGP